MRKQIDQRFGWDSVDREQRASASLKNSHAKTMEKKPGRFGSWVKVRCLGSGTSGVVTLWENLETKERIAIKMNKGSEFKERQMNEVRMMKKLSHENLVKVIAAPPELQRIASMILCMEYCADGNLRQVLNKPENCSGLDENTVRQCLKNVKDGLEYIHSQNIIHRDLKPENIVLQKTNDGVIFKLIDLGFGIEGDKRGAETSLVGTLHYVAPEAFFDECSSAGDYWSLGVICHEMITGFRPFLPHLSPLVWIEKVRFKTDNVICVYERIFDDSHNNVVFSERLFEENRLSKPLVNHLEVWLRTALKFNHRNRGRTKQNELIIFSSLEEILNTKVVSVFSAVRYRVLWYEIDEQTTILTVKENVMKDTGQPVHDQVLLLPSGDSIADNLSAVEIWDPTCEVAMLYAFTDESISLQFELSLPPALIRTVDDEKEPLTYPKRKRAFANAIHFIQSQLNLCKAVYEAVAVQLLSVLKLLDGLTSREEAVRTELVHCNAKLRLLRLSVEFNEKCYSRAREAKAVPQNEQFLDEHKKLTPFKAQLERYERSSSECRELLRRLRALFDETRAFESAAEGTEKLTKCLEEGYGAFDHLSRLPKELRDSEGNCIVMVNVIHHFFEALESFVNDDRFARTIDKAKSCRKEIAMLTFELGKLGREVQTLNANIVRAELSMFRAVWNLKVFLPQEREAADRRSSSALTTSSSQVSSSELIANNRELLRRLEATTSAYGQQLDEYLNADTTNE